jgi:hypothetical protein
MNNIKITKFAAKLGIILAIMLMNIPSTFARNTNPGILPPYSSAYGMSYGKWSAKWWQWNYSMPVDAHPLYDTADCSAGQSGKVWFLGGTTTATTDLNGDQIWLAERYCTVPTGTALFFPIINSEAATLEGDGVGYEALRSKAEFYQNHAVDLEATIDGVEVKNLNKYRVKSPLSVYGPLPPNNVPLNNGFLDAVAGATSDFVADGVFLMVSPLPVGEHVITFKGKAVFAIADGDPFDFIFNLDGTYHITVEPGKKK